jgi:hypothetical protein
MSKITFTLFFAICLCLIFNKINAQDTSIREVSKLSDSLVTVIDDNKKATISNKIEQLLCQALRDSSSFKKNELKELKRIGDVMSPDSSFRLVSWNYFKTDGSSVCNTILQQKAKTDTCNLFCFNNKPVQKQENKQQYTGNQIPAALYYQIIPTNFKGYSNMYIVLGMKTGNLMTQSKSIETLYFNKNGIPVMGTPVFQYNNLVINRFEFFYSAKVRMSIKYIDAEKAIIIDHLSPEKPFFAGQYEYYGPDGSFDAILYNENKWLFISDYNLFKSKKTTN